MNYTNAIRVSEEDFEAMTIDERREVLKPIVKNLNRNIRRMRATFDEDSPAVRNLKERIEGKIKSKKLNASYPGDKFKTPKDYDQMKVVFEIAKDFAALQTATITGEKKRQANQMKRLGEIVGDEDFGKYYNKLSPDDKKAFWKAYRRIEENKEKDKGWLRTHGEYDSGTVINAMSEVVRGLTGEYEDRIIRTPDDFYAAINEKLEEMNKKNVKKL